MSNTIYLEIDSTHRNRKSFPYISDFEVQVSQSGARSKETSLDPVSLSAPIAQWTGNRFNMTTSGTSITVQVTNNTSGIGYATENVNLIIKTTSGRLQKTKNYYLSAIVRFQLTTGPPATYAYRNISYYEWLSNDGTYDYARLVLSSSFQDSVLPLGTGVQIDILDPTELTTTPPSIFVPSGYVGANCYYGLYLYNETNSQYRKIINYDVSVNLALLESAVSGWNATDNYSIRKEIPIVTSTNFTAKQKIINIYESLSKEVLSKTQNYYIGDFIRVIADSSVYGSNQIAPSGETKKIISSASVPLSYFLWGEIGKNLITEIAPYASSFASNGNISLAFTKLTNPNFAYSYNMVSPEQDWVVGPVFILYAFNVIWVSSLSMFIVAGYTYSTYPIAYSYDGLNWQTNISSYNNMQYGYGIASKGSTVVAVGDRIGLSFLSTIMYSNNGINWTGLGYSIFSGYGSDIVASNNIFVAVGYGTNTIAYSYDGITWTGLGASIFTSIGIAVAWSDNLNRFVAVGNSTTSTMAWSDDGITWTGLGNSQFAGHADDVVWAGGSVNKFVAVGNSAGVSYGGAAYSSDGKVWTRVNLFSGFSTGGYSVIWNGYKLMATGNNFDYTYFTNQNTGAYSYDAINWHFDRNTRGVENEYQSFVPQINSTIYMNIISNYKDNLGYYLIMTNSDCSLIKKYGPVLSTQTVQEVFDVTKWDTYTTIGTTPPVLWATFYDGTNYTGYSVQFGPYGYEWLENYGFPDNAVSSIKVPLGLKVTGFANSTFTGSRVSVVVDTPDLSVYGMNNSISSCWNVRTEAILFSTEYVKKTFVIESQFSSTPDVFDHKLEVMRWSYDNCYDLSYSGPLISQPEMVCIELLNIILPNKTLNTQYGSRIAYYPYVYVELSNVASGGSALTNIIYSNNPNSSRTLFRACVDDMNQPQNSAFIKIDGDRMVQKLKFQANSTLHFRVILPNGELFQVNDPEYFSPNEPNDKNQITALFAIKRN